MGTSEHSQATLFEDGSENERRELNLWPTPKAMLGDHPGQSKVKPGQELHLTIAANSGMELTSSPGGSRVNPSLSPGSSWARRMTGISGRRCFGSLTSFGRLESLVRTLLVSSAWGSTRCYLTWRRSATPAGRSLFLLRPSVPPTGATGFGFWPTPNVAGGGNMCELTPHKGHFLRPSGEKAHLGLDQAVRMWPTPTSSESTGAGHTGEGGMNLRTAVKLMPTPTARDWKDGSSVQNVPENGLLGRWSVNHSTTPGPGQKLSAAWTSRLMGYPSGWLDLDGESDPT